MRAMSVIAVGAAAMMMTSVAAAKVKYTTQSVAGVQLAVPQGWHVSQSAQPVPTIRIEEKPGATDKPSVILMTMPLSQGPQTAAFMARQLVQAAMPGGQQFNQQAAGGGVLTEWKGPINGISAKMTVIHQADTNAGVGVVAAFAAPGKRYDRLGGPKLLMTVMSGQAAPAPVAAAPAQKGGNLKIPAQYRRSSKPTLDYLVDRFDQLSPSQVAQAMRQFNATEWQLLSIYNAFANLVHALGCQADQSLRLPTGANCAQTMASWQQTLQLLGGNQQAALEQAMGERTQLQIANRCSTGQHDAASCAAYTRTMSNMSAQNHDTMMHIIRNMGGNTCTVGEPGCVPY